MGGKRREGDGRGRRRTGEGFCVSKKGGAGRRADCTAVGAGGEEVTRVAGGGGGGPRRGV